MNIVYTQTLLRISVSLYVANTCCQKKIICYRAFMSRYPDRKNEVTPHALRTYAGFLRKLADTHDMLSDWMEKSGSPIVMTKNLTSGLGGLVSLSKFLGAVVAAHCENEAAQGVGEIEGASAELRRLAKRLKSENDNRKIADVPESRSVLVKKLKKAAKVGTNGGTRKP